MERTSKYRRKTIAGFVLVALAAAPLWAGDKQKKKSSDPGKPAQVVWPLPPEKARFVFVRFLYGAGDVEPPKKPGFFDRIAGIKKTEFKPPFVKPYGLATDSQRRLFVADSAVGVVFVLDPKDKKVTYLGRGQQGRLIMPIGLTVDPRDRVWVADVVQRQVFVYGPEGNVEMVFGQRGEFQSPTDVAVDESRRRVYVADSKKHCVHVLDEENGTYLKQIGERGTESGKFNFPTNLALDKQGRLYVVDTMNFRVQIFDPEYNYVGGFGKQGVSFGEFLRPKGIALDSYGNIYVVDSDFNNFQVFDQRKRLLMFIGRGGVLPGQFQVPAGIHIDGEDFIYVSDQTNRRIQIFKLLDGSVEEPTPASATGAAKSPGADQGGGTAEAQRPTSSPLFDK